MIGFAQLEPFLDHKRHELLMALIEFSMGEANSLSEVAEGWTPRHIVEHLAKVEQTVIAQMKTLLGSEPPRPSEPLDGKFVDITDMLRERGLLGTNKKTPPALEPSGHQLKRIRAAHSCYI